MTNPDEITPTNTTRVEPTIAGIILDTYTLQLEDEVRSLRRRCWLWERCFWVQTVLALILGGTTLWAAARLP